MTPEELIAKIHTILDRRISEYADEPANTPISAFGLLLLIDAFNEEDFKEVEKLTNIFLR